MSYCVNCGVELGENEKRCPLCDTIVLNPRTFGAAGGKAVSEENVPQKEMELLSHFHVDFKLLATIISVFLIVPITVTIICNFVADNKLTWSLYVLGASVLTFVIMLMPAFFEKKNPYGFIAVDSICVFLYLYLISFLTGGKWALSLALPICVMTMVFAMFYTMALRNKKVEKLIKVSIFILFAGLYSLATEIIINDALNKGFMLHWSHYVLIPCAVVSLILLIIDSQKKLKEELRKKLFM